MLSAADKADLAKGHGDSAQPLQAYKAGNFEKGDVKIGFKSEHGKDVEHMWVEITKINGSLDVHRYQPHDSRRFYGQGSRKIEKREKAKSR